MLDSSKSQSPVRWDVLCPWRRECRFAILFSKR